MPSRRLLKAAEAIREVVSMAILTELKDPRVKNVTVTSVEVLPDMKQARVYVTIMGDEKMQKLTLRGLQNAAGFLQYKIADRIETRYTPRLEFVFDEGVKNALEIDRILKRVLPKDPAAADDDRRLAIEAGDDEAAGSPEAFASEDPLSDDRSLEDRDEPSDDASPADDEPSEVDDAPPDGPRDHRSDESP